MMLALGLLSSLAIVVGQTTQWAVLSIGLLALTLWRKVEITFLHWVGLAFLAWACLSLSWTYDWYDGGWGLWILAIIALSFWLGSALPSLRSIYIGLALGLTVSSIFSIAEFFDWQGVATAYPHCHGNPAIEWRTCWKVAGLYHNPMLHGELLAITLVALLSERLWLLVPGLLPGFILAGSRGAIVALVMGGTAVLVRKPLAILTLGGIFALAFATYLGPSDSDRFAIWRIALQGMTWLGYGPGSFSGVATATMHPEHVHNDYLQLAFEYGSGSLLLLFLYACAILQTNAKEWPVFLTFSILALFSFPLYVPMLAFLGAASTGRLAREWSLASTHGNSRRHSLPTWSPPWPLRLDRIRSTAVPLESRIPNSVPDLEQVR